MEQWEIDQLNYDLKLIEATLGITYKGNSLIGKKLFVNGYMEECQKVVQQRLNEEYEDMIQYEEEKAIVEQLGEDYLKVVNSEYIDMPLNMNADEYREWRNKMKRGRI
ncbi:hypothetical protein D7X33_28060 [Butyricicoccus sp. 1XD8-22]|nr:hypothetical protein D7X33_28060 [Butyricicoccus sp. 1XD8-22]